MKKKMLITITLLIGLSLLFTGCGGSGAGTVSWLGLDFAVDKIEAIQLIDLNGELVRELNPAEYEGIAAGIIKAKEDESPYIMMITGYTMIIKLADGEIRFTSYGSETNVVASVTVDDKSESKHLVCPEIAQILIADADQDTSANE